MKIHRIMSIAGACALVACSPAQKPAAYAAPPQPVSQTVLSSAPLTPGKTTPVSPSIAVSDELLQACKLDLDDVANAPKFDFDKSELTGADYAVLTRIGRCLDAGALSGMGIVLVGRADPRGSDAYNLTLGAQRAHRVAAFFEDFGIDESRIEEVSRGKRDAVGTGEASWQLDRRVDILLGD